MKPAATTPGWFLSHWRGETSLGISYWLNGILLGTLLPALIVIGYSLINPFPHSLRVNALAILILITLRLCLWIWTVVGVIRSANRHTSRGGKLFWANTARVVICITVVLTLVRLEKFLIPQMRLLAAIAGGHDPMDTVTVEVTPDGRTIMLEGTLGAGSVDKVQRIIDSSPDATTLELNSDGGRGQTAEELARRVRERHLNTSVQDHCVSACTYIFLAGANRTLADDAALGFHQASPLRPAPNDKTAIRDMVAYYRFAVCANRSSITSGDATRRHVASHAPRARRRRRDYSRAHRSHRIAHAVIQIDRRDKRDNG
jgi:hypothetical protein